MVKHKSLKPNLNAFQVDPTSVDIFFSGSERPVDNSHSPLVYHAEAAGPVTSEVADIPFKAVKHPDDIDPGTVIMRNKRKHNAVEEALKIRFSNILSTVVDYGITREQSKPTHERHKIFQPHKN